MEPRRVLLTGSEGHLGCLLGPDLLDDGHDVVGVDTGSYRNGWLYRGVDRTVFNRGLDVRRLVVDDLRGFDAVVRNAELSDDPLGDLIGDTTYDIDQKGSVRLATLTKAPVARPP